MVAGSSADCQIVPDTAEFLTEREKTFIQARLPPNAPRASEENFNLHEIYVALKDKRLWLFTLIWATFTAGTSGVRFYQPTVIANLGFTGIAQAQLLNLPISLLAIVVIGITGFFADNARLPRPVYPLGIFTIIIACYAVLVCWSYTHPMVPYTPLLSSEMHVQRHFSHSCGRGVCRQHHARPEVLSRLDL